MTMNSFKAAVFVLFSMFLFGSGAIAANDVAKRDANRVTNIMGVDDSGYIKNILVDSSGQLSVGVASGTILVDLARTITYATASVGATATADITFSSDTFTVCMYNSGAALVTVVVDPDTNYDAATDNGLPVPANSGRCWENIEINKVSVYNFDTSAALVFFEGRRK